MDCLRVLEAASLKSRCGQGWFLPRTGKEGSAPGLSPWLVDGHLLPSHRFPAMCVGVQISPFYKGTSHIGVGPILRISF